MAAGDKGKDYFDSLPDTDDIFGEEFLFEELTLVALTTDDLPSTKDVPQELSTTIKQLIDASLNPLKTTSDVVKFEQDVDSLKKTSIIIKDAQHDSAKYIASITHYFETDIKNYGTYKVPVFKEKLLKEVDERLMADIHKVQEEIVGIGTFMCEKTLDKSKMLSLVIGKAARVIAELKIDKPFNKTSTQALILDMLTTIRTNLVIMVNKEYEPLEKSVDPSFDGLWVTGNPRIPIRGRYGLSEVRLDCKQTLSLRDIIFSLDHGQCAKSKLNFYAHLDSKLAARARTNPERLLRDALTAATLTNVEIASIMFLTEERGSYACIACAKPVELGATIYHPKCTIATWLTKEFHFKYDDKERALLVGNLTYLTQAQRMLLSKINDLAAQIEKRKLARKTERGGIQFMDRSKSGASSSLTIHP